MPDNKIIKVTHYFTLSKENRQTYKDFKKEYKNNPCSAFVIDNLVCLLGMKEFIRLTETGELKNVVFPEVSKKDKKNK
jgi:tryptophan synthase alpha subunit